MLNYNKESALKLRLQGKSYNEIYKLLGVPKSTLSGWLKNVQLSDQAARRIAQKAYKQATAALIKRNKLQTLIARKQADQIKFSAKKEIKDITDRELLILGTSLYWAEGHKRPIVKDGRARTFHPVSLSNSDPKLIQTFLEFLRKVCKVPENKLHAGLRIYKHQNSQQLLQFWSKMTKIPEERFEKFYYGVSKSSLGKRPYNILPYGTIQIRVYDTKLYHKIMGWIEGLGSAI